MLELLYKETFGVNFHEEDEQIQELTIAIWNMALSAINRQIILISFNEALINEQQ
jgi:hypothetical protein